MQIDIMWAFLTFCIGLWVGGRWMGLAIEKALKEKNHG